jgi:hypothetical protein
MYPDTNPTGIQVAGLTLTVRLASYQDIRYTTGGRILGRNCRKKSEDFCSILFTVTSTS